MSRILRGFHLYLPQEEQALWGHLSLPQLGHLAKEPRESLWLIFLVADLDFVCFFLGNGVIPTNFNLNEGKMAIVTFNL